MHKDKMIGYLPPYERKSNIFQEIFTAAGIELDTMDLTIEDVEAQLSVDTATWGLVFYEKDLKITPDLSKPYEERRSVIKSKWRGVGKIDRTLIKLVVDAFTNGDCEVTFDGKINITFTSVYGIPPNMTDVQKILSDIRPAHLGLLYIYIYMTWAEHDTYNKTWDQWDALNLTWDEKEAYREVV